MVMEFVEFQVLIEFVEFRVLIEFVDFRMASMIAVSVELEDYLTRVVGVKVTEFRSLRRPERARIQVKEER